MKITKSQLKRIIKEEVLRLVEGDVIKFPGSKKPSTKARPWQRGDAEVVSMDDRRKQQAADEEDERFQAALNSARSDGLFNDRPGAGSTNYADAIATIMSHDLFKNASAADKRTAKRKILKQAKEDFFEEGGWEALGVHPIEGEEEYGSDLSLRLSKAAGMDYTDWGMEFGELWSDVFFGDGDWE